MSSRAWIKINCSRWFDGTIRKEPIEVRAIWADLLVLAGRTGQDGVIRLPGLDIGYTDDQISAIFNVPICTWRKAKEQLSNHPGGKQENRIRVTDGNVIEIIHWNAYQSEYSRQKSYRQKLQAKVTTKSAGRKKEKEGERKILNTRSKPTVRSRVAERTSYPEEFKSFWSAYPRRVAKQVALEKFTAALKSEGVEPQDIISAAEEYKNQCESEKKEEKYIMHPSTFLAKDRWKDYCYEPAKSDCDLHMPR